MRYMMYASGEIILVVAGILIALQVNTWNENRKTRELEQSILQELHDNLLADEASLKNDIRINRNIIGSSVHLVNALAENFPLHDSLQLHMGNLAWNTVFTLKKSGYENLKSAGFQVIRNDSLRQAITELYESEYPFLMAIQEQSGQMTWEYFLPRYLEFMENVEFTGSGRSNTMRRYVPVNYEDLRDNVEFHRLLSVLEENKHEVNLSLNTTINRIIDLREYIELELDSR